ncbi:MAG TPA: hypothetical protein VJJ02_01590 [Candidatus Paceibacterota bacterium]
MKHTKQRLPLGVVEKLAKNPGGGTHKSPKTYDRRREKQQLRKQVSDLS